MYCSLGDHKWLNVLGKTTQLYKIAFVGSIIHNCISLYQMDRSYGWSQFKSDWLQQGNFDGIKELTVIEGPAQNSCWESHHGGLWRLMLQTTDLRYTFVVPLGTVLSSFLCENIIQNYPYQVIIFYFKNTVANLRCW